MVVAADSIRESTAVTGTGAATLLGATDYARAFSNASVFSSRPVSGIPYRIDAIDGAAFTAGQCEQGVGTLQADGTFARTTPTWSKSSGSVSAGACNFLAGTKTLAVVASFDSVVELTTAAASAASTALASHVAASDPHTQYQLKTGLGAANGYASLDGSVKVPLAQLPTGTNSTSVALGNAPSAAVTSHVAATDPHGDRAYTDAALAAALIPRRVSVTADFGSTFTDKASTVVTGLTWLTTSHILTPVLRPTADVDEIRLLDLKPVISDVIAGVGFTLSVISEPESRGQYTFLVVGV